MRVLIWHVHGSWMTAFVQGGHEYLVPVLPSRGPDGRGRAQTWDWPDSVVEVTPAEAADARIDVVVMQRPEELHHLVETWTQRRPGRELPAVYVEHNTPPGVNGEARHPCYDRGDITVAHVTHFNDVYWDCGETRTAVIEHGVVDPGHRYTGELPRSVAVINEARRRGRYTGTDLLAELGRETPLDLFGMDFAAVAGGAGELGQDELHTEMARRRVYVHPCRWTSLGLSLVEAMHLGLPVVALAATAAVEAVPADAGVVSCDLDRLRAGIRGFARDPEAAHRAGTAARRHALERFGLQRFLDDWDALLAEVCS